VAKEATGARIHRRHEDRPRRIRRGRARPRNGDTPVFKRLAQRLKCRGGIFRELVQEERATMPDRARMSPGQNRSKVAGKLAFLATKRSTSGVEKVVETCGQRGGEVGGEDCGRSS